MIQFTATTYESTTHVYVIQLLTSMDCKFEYSLDKTEQAYSRFRIIGPQAAFERLRRIVQENNIYVVTLEYGI
jgi:hypothetical protein